jgi:hypothetical protein
VSKVLLLHQDQNLERVLDHGCSGSGFFSLLLSLFLADGVLDFLSFGDCDLFFAEDDLLPFGDLGDCDLELSPDFGLDGGAEPCSLVGNSGD